MAYNYKEGSSIMQMQGSKMGTEACSEDKRPTEILTRLIASAASARDEAALPICCTLVAPSRDVGIAQTSWLLRRTPHAIHTGNTLSHKAPQ